MKKLYFVEKEMEKKMKKSQKICFKNQKVIPDSSYFFYFEKVIIILNKIHFVVVRTVGLFTLHAP
jgi:hypothetical protein